MAQIRLEADDVVAAQRLHSRPSGWRHLIYAFGFVAVASLCATTYFVPAANRDPSVLLTVGLPLLLCLLAVALLRFVYLPWFGRRMYRQQKSLRDPAEVEWNDAGITFRSATVQGTTAWEDFLKWKEDDRLFLLYLSSCLFHMVPKRAFQSPADEQNFRQHLARVGANQLA